MDNFYFEMEYSVDAEFDPAEYLLSIGTIRLNIPEELNLDFENSEWSMKSQSDGARVIHAYAYDFDNDVFQHEYNALGLSVDSMNYEFFSKRLDTIRVAEVYTEFYTVNTSTEIYIPLKLESLNLIFPIDEKKIDLTKKIQMNVSKRSTMWNKSFQQIKMSTLKSKR